MIPDVQPLNHALKALGLGELKVTGGRPLSDDGPWRFDCPQCSADLPPNLGSKSVSVSPDGKEFACQNAGCNFRGTLAQLEARLARLAAKAEPKRTSRRRPAGNRRSILTKRRTRSSR